MSNSPSSSTIERVSVDASAAVAKALNQAAPHLDTLHEKHSQACFERQLRIYIVKQSVRQTHCILGFAAMLTVLLVIYPAVMRLQPKMLGMLVTIFILAMVSSGNNIRQALGSPPLR